MLNVLKARLQQGYQTGKFPPAPPNLPDRFLGRPSIDMAKCSADCDLCQQVCPTKAIVPADDAKGGKKALSIDMGRCLFCGECVAACPTKAITFNPTDFHLSTFCREGLLDPQQRGEPPQELQDLCGLSLVIRQVSAGGCAACELDFNVLNTLAWDLSRFGISVTASPRHADCLLVTGPVTRNMLIGLQKTYDAMPRPKWVIACGACAISGGIYQDSSECLGGLEDVIKPDLYIPGCPPHPATILQGILHLMGKHIPKDAATQSKS
ncbi:MAG TPA: NADH-quinone oxidoreductase subunit NuoB [Lentisphaeria bacterium]|nr:NADH-quinone oxidoreductase subunit NuoB [Lentisphaerota bacterium]OQC12302.1 MAG: NAD(P)H-quinone oxidoreductase subunit K 1 precursor [Lentisphaerae bacterium ADurb.Bin082]HPY91291.1 NADH-quinone oxidoreductase subunit NuoB [Lentisphaeria bacterium]HQL86309.1 NADH-quinone oxidoreductase subunit NuoB [Lentisphaeria bacterium]